jgi:uncharacterized protein YgbK (DUF1537 family)
MIVVIADDLSGAAELASTARRHGLSAEVQTDFFPASPADVLCVDTNSRLLPAEEAAQRVAAIARNVVAARPAWIFKKCDSVLRGPVLAEARAIAAAAGRQRILLLPANPSRARTIRAGRYLVADRPLNETAFATDPTHPRLTADVQTLLGGDLAAIAVPDIETARDVRSQAERVDAQTLPVGAVDFFTALLEVRTPAANIPRPQPPVASRTLLVCGSQAAWSQRSAAAATRGTPVFDLPHDIPSIIGALRTHRTVIIGIGNRPVTRQIASHELTSQLAGTVAAILRETPVEQLLLEGGATAAAVIAALGWTRLHAELSSEPEVGVLRPVGATAPLVVIKPGSYPWPAAYWA